MPFSVIEFRLRPARRRLLSGDTEGVVSDDLVRESLEAGHERARAWQRAAGAHGQRVLARSQQAADLEAAHPVPGVPAADARAVEEGLELIVGGDRQRDALGHGLQLKGPAEEPRLGRRPAWGALALDPYPGRCGGYRGQLGCQ